MSRDDKASYYDLELPDGTVVEAQDVTRALLERAALPPYASKCLGTLLERVWRFGAKPDTDTAREAEKVVTEATFLCEALGGVPSFTMQDVARAAHDAGIEIKFGGGRAGGNTAMLTTPGSELRWPMPVAHCPGANGHTCDGGRLVECDEHGETDAGPCPRCNPPPPQTYRDRIAELERDLGTWKRAADYWHGNYNNLRPKAVAAERDRDEAREDAIKVKRTYNELFDSTGKEITTLRQQLAALRDRYRPRRQSEEPAPDGVRVMVWSNDDSPRWMWRDGQYVNANETWTHQPPAPGEEE